MNVNYDDQMPDQRWIPFSLNDDKDSTVEGESETNSTDTTISEDSCDGKIEDDCESGSTNMTTITTNEAPCQETHENRRNLRSLPTRSKKRNTQTKRDLRIPMKPQRVSAKSTAKLSPSEIRKLYSNQKLTKFRPTKLETIFEEPQRVHSRAPVDADAQLRLIGPTKVRRSLTCNDGFNINRTLIKQRRAKIKKTFGHRHKLKKIPLQGFLDHLHKNVNVLGANDSDECETQQPFLPDRDPLTNAIAKVVEESVGVTED